MKLMVIGFPKSGTTSITAALKASGLKTAHWQLDNNRFVGGLIYKAVVNGLDPFEYLKDFDAVTQADVCLPNHNLSLWPNLDFAVLSAIRRAHPTCLFLLNTRRPEAICDSMADWPFMQKRFEMSDIPGLPRGTGGKREHLMAWIENHYAACRHFFAGDEYFLELDIERSDAPEILGQALGIEIGSWGNVKPERPIPIPPGTTPPPGTVLIGAGGPKAGGPKAPAPAAKRGQAQKRPTS